LLNAYLPYLQQQCVLATAAYNRLPHNTGRYGNIQVSSPGLSGTVTTTLLVVPSATAPIDTGGNLTSCVTSKTTTISTIRHPILMASTLFGSSLENLSEGAQKEDQARCQQVAKSLKVTFFKYLVGAVN